MSNKEIRLPPRITQIVMFSFQNPDMTYTELAKQFGISVSRVSQIMNDTRVLEAFPIIAKRRIKSLVPRAVKRLESLMNQNDNLVVSERAVSKVLDSEKVLEPQERKIVHEIQMKSTDELRAIIEGAKSIPSPVIDAELLDVDDENAAA